MAAAVTQMRDEDGPEWNNVRADGEHRVDSRYKGLCRAGMSAVDWKWSVNEKRIRNDSGICSLST